MGDVLVVENHSEHEMNLVRMLDDLNMNWRLGGSVAEGVERIARKKPKLALVADWLPDGSGSRLLQVAIVKGIRSRRIFLPPLRERREDIPYRWESGPCM
jgi:DNA-binding NtrC family response regulator